MSIQELLLTKEEVPISQKRYLIVPIHPLLLTERLDPRLANNVFPMAAHEWYAELQAVEGTPKEREWYKSVFLQHEPIIEQRGANQVMTPPSGGWFDHVTTNDNGFATLLGINRNQGMLMLMSGSRAMKYITPPIINFTQEKFKRYAAEEPFPRARGVHAFVYNCENITGLPSALFLRNWAVLYLNEALKYIESKLGV